MTLLNENDILKNITDDNRWWKTGAIDKSLVPDFKRKEYDRVVQILFNKIRRIPVLTGARRVGKSTIIFQIIDELLHKDINPKKIFFYTLDEFSNDGITIKEALEVYKKYVYEGSDYYLFVDEAQKDKNWKNYIKKLYDLNKNVRILITGSSSTELEKDSSESGAGRFYTVKIPTMSFYEFCSLNGKIIDLPQVDVFKMHMLSLVEQSSIIMACENLYSEFIRYMKLGGFPEYAQSDDYGYVSKLIRDQVINKAIKEDIPRAFDIKNGDALTNLFTFFCYNTSNVVNVDTLSKLLEIDRSTINNYINILEKTNLIYTAEQLSVGGKKPLKPKRKIHIADNGIRCSVTRNNDVETNAQEFGLACETICYKHVRDYCDRVDNNLYTVGYIRTDKNQEVDIVIQDNSKITQLIEVKQKNDAAIKDSDGIVILGLEGIPGYVITKNIEDFGLFQRKQTELYRIPAVAFLYLLGKMA